MTKKLLILFVLLFVVSGVWAQVAGNPVTTASSINVCTGATTVDIPITISDFIAVGSISLKFVYVNTEITSPSVIYKDPGITAWGTFVANTGMAGTIIISVYDPDTEEPTGLTLDDGTTLLTLRFTIGTITTPAALTFVENAQGTSCEYGGVGPAYTPFIDTLTGTYYIPGGVTVNTVDAGAIAGTQTICSGGDPVAFTSSTSGTGEGTITYRWELNTDLETPDWNTISGATSSTYNADVLTADAQYRRVTISTLYSIACESISNVLTVTVNERKTISGVFNYYYLDGDVLLTGEDIYLELFKSLDTGHDTLLAKDTTSVAGYYEFLNLCPDCNYDIVATSDHITAGAFNTTDAALTNYWGVQPYLIEKVKFLAGNVGTSGNDPDFSINATDAVRIQRNFVNGSAFDNPWRFWKAGSSISANPATGLYPSVNLLVGSDLTTNMYGLYTGDFNQSFNPDPVKSASSTLDLIYAGDRQVSNNQEFDLPLKMVNASGVGAVSLILNFPEEMVEVLDVTMEDAGGQLDWAVKGNELRIGWNSSVPLNLAAASELVTLRLKTTTAFTVGNSIRIAMASDPLNELANELYNVIGDAVLSVDVIDASAVGIDDHGVDDRITMNNYPNPFSSYTMITYSLPFDGKVTLEIYSILGKKVTSLVSQTQSAGNHMVKYDTSGQPSGIYIATLRIKSANDELIRTIKLINNK